MKLFKFLIVLCLIGGIAYAAYTYLLGGHEHSFADDWSSDAEAHWHACSGEGCTELSDKAAHTFGEGKETTPATESEEGVMTYTCTVCGYEKLESIDKLAHTHSITKVDEVPADCTKAGTEAYYKCGGCDKLFSDAEGKNAIDAPAAIDRLEHKDENPKDHKCDSCEAAMNDGGCKNEDGDDKCDICDAPMCVSHTPAEAVKENEVAATCEKTGSYESVVYCATCGEEISRETVIVDKAEHNWNDTTTCASCGFMKGTVRFEGVNGVLYGEGTKITTGQNSTLDGFVDWAAGGSIKFSFTASSAGTAILNICSGQRQEITLDQVFSIKVNGTEITVPATTVTNLGGWFKWGITSAGEISLVEGLNTIEIIAGENYNTLDYIELVLPEGLAVKHSKAVLEASQATLTGVATLGTGQKAWSNDFVDFHADQGDQSATFTFIATNDCAANFYLRLGKRGSFALSDVYTIKINGVEIDLSAVSFEGIKDSWFNWDTILAGQFNLKDGVNTIEIVGGDCCCLLDCIIIEVVE